MQHYKETGFGQCQAGIATKIIPWGFICGLYDKVWDSMSGLYAAGRRPTGLLPGGWGQGYA
jgi:hypothetical protein